MTTSTGLTPRMLYGKHPRRKARRRCQRRRQHLAIKRSWCRRMQPRGRVTGREVKKGVKLGQRYILRLLVSRLATIKANLTVSISRPPINLPKRAVATQTCHTNAKQAIPTTIPQQILSLRQQLWKK